MELTATEKSMRSLVITLLLGASCLLMACNNKTGTTNGSTNNTASGGPSANTPKQSASIPPSVPGKISKYSYEVVKEYPHDPKSFTQGLVFYNGSFIESAGEYGVSDLREVELQSGRVLRKTDVAERFFAEGMTIFRGKIYQLTWQEHVCFVYDPQTFRQISQFNYDGEGWGLTHDDQNLILSDGTNQLRFIDPDSFKVVKTISVFSNNRPLLDLNELEYIRGEVFANIWHSDRIARIDPNSGEILGWIDLTGLLPLEKRSDEEAVLNGIAYDEATDRLFVTGKLWPQLFEIRLKAV